jgi:hypothetical protein
MSIRIVETCPNSLVIYACGLSLPLFLSAAVAEKWTVKHPKGEGGLRSYLLF